MLANDAVRLPKVIVFTGPNGSGSKGGRIEGRMINDKKDFTFETVLSNDRNLLLLQKAKEQGYFVRGIYVLTSNVDINIARVQAKKALGGHGVPEEKISIGVMMI